MNLRRHLVLGWIKFLVLGWDLLGLLELLLL
jgi:hypothetical protein